MRFSTSGNKQFYSFVLPYRCLKYDARVIALHTILVQVAMIADLASQCRRKDVVQTNCMVALVNITSINGHEVRGMGQVVCLKKIHTRGLLPSTVGRIGHLRLKEGLLEGSSSDDKGSTYGGLHYTTVVPLGSLAGPVEAFP